MNHTGLADARHELLPYNIYADVHGFDGINDRNRERCFHDTPEVCRSG